MLNVNSRMRPWRNILLVLLTGFAATALLVQFRPSHSFEGKPVAAWFRELNGMDATARADAADAIHRMGSLAIPHLHEMLQQQDGPVQEQAARLSKRFGVPYRDVDPVDVRMRAAKLLSELPQCSTESAPILIEALGDEEGRVRAEAARSLIRLKRLDDLLEATRSDNPLIRLHSLRALVEVDSRNPQTLHAAMRLTSDRNADVREEAAQALGQLQVNLSDQCTALESVLKDAHPAVRVAACRSLANLGAAAVMALDACGRALSDPEPAVRVQAASACWRISRQPTPARETLMAALHEPGVGWEAALILGEMGAAAECAVPELVRALKRERVPRPFRTPPSSATALGRIGAAAVNPLVEALRDNSTLVRIHAALALALVGGPATNAIPALQNALTDENADVQNASIVALIQIGAQERSLVEPLRRMLAAEDIYLRSMAVNALRRIAPEQQWEALAE